MLQDYISTQVVRRSAWEAAVARLGPDGIAAGLNFPHLPILGEVITTDPRWAWVAAPSSAIASACSPCRTRSTAA